MKSKYILLIASLGFCFDLSDTAIGKGEGSVTNGAAAKIATWIQPVERKIEVLALKSLAFKEAEKALEPLLSENGLLVPLETDNAVMVYDIPARIKLIKQLLNEIDRDPVNIRITVSFDATGTKERSGLGLEKGETDVRISPRGTDLRGKFSLRAEKSAASGTSRSSQFILTRNNNPARIWVGKQVAHQVWTYKYGIRHGWWSSDIVYRDIGASLWALPRMVGDGKIVVQVYPRLTLEGPKALTVEAKELATEVVVADGGTARIGGLDKETRNAYRYLFGVGRVFNGSTLSITLGADIMRPGKKSR
ncbi:MAG: secretin N-terminal domain-containing protein [Verrucomicrobiota bacterium]